jgi:hypothetical protein
MSASSAIDVEEFVVRDSSQPGQLLSRRERGEIVVLQGSYKDFQEQIFRVFQGAYVRAQIAENDRSIALIESRLAVIVL